MFLSKEQEILYQYFPIGDNNPVQEGSSSLPIDKSTVKDALTEVLSEFLALKNLLLKKSSHLPDQSKDTERD